MVSAWLAMLMIASALRAQIPPPPRLFDDAKPAPQPEETLPAPRALDRPRAAVDRPTPPALPPNKSTRKSDDPPKTESPELPKPGLVSRPATQGVPPTPKAMDGDETPFTAPPPKRLPIAPPDPIPPPPPSKSSSPPPAAATPAPAAAPAIEIQFNPFDYSAGSNFDTYRFWVGGDFNLWWFQKSPLSAPLAVTTTSPASSTANILGVDPNARVFIGPAQMSQNPSNGARVWLGTWLDDHRSLGVEVVGMYVESPTTTRAVSSSATGSPLYGRPVMIAGDGSSVYDISFPAFLAGNFNVESHQFLRGIEANFVGFLVGREQLFFDVIAGARFLNFEDQLDMRHQMINLTPMPSFGTAILTPGTIVNATDSYHANNNFYGGQIGGRLERNFGRLSLAATGKVALGVNDMSLTVGGVTTRSDSTKIYSGGILANSANMGRFTESHFAIVPEANLAIGWWFTPNFRAKIGYNILYISDVVRAGNHIQNTVNPGAVPVDPAYGLMPVTRSPIPLQRSDFWADGITFGIDFRY